MVWALRNLAAGATPISVVFSPREPLKFMITSRSASLSGPVVPREREPKGPVLWGGRLAGGYPQRAHGRYRLQITAEATDIVYNRSNEWSGWRL